MMASRFSLMFFGILGALGIAYVYVVLREVFKLIKGR